MGNWLYKEWSQLDSGDDLPNSLSKQKNNKSNRKSMTNFPTSNEATPNEVRRNSLSNLTSADKVVMADFDPRSPSSGIPRTPICYLNENEANKKLAMIDPRSPTNEYNRTPIHCNKKSKINSDINNSLFDDSISSNFENTSIISTDSSVLLQQVPDNIQNSSPYTSSESPSKAVNVKSRSSNMPSHILQRKQVQKLNKNKLTESQDKENQC